MQNSQELMDKDKEDEENERSIGDNNNVDAILQTPKIPKKRRILDNAQERIDDAYKIIKQMSQPNE